MTKPNTNDLREEIVRFARYCNTLTPYKLDEPLDPMVNEAINDLESLFTNHTAKAEKAYGGCRNCYGKGYATKQDFVQAVRSGKKYPSDPMKYCTCDRGQQLEKLVSYHTAKAEIAEIKEWITIADHSFEDHARIADLMRAHVSKLEATLNQPPQPSNDKELEK